MKNTIGVVCILVLLAACSQSERPAPETATDSASENNTESAPESAVDLATVYRSAVDNEARSNGDRERDALRKPDRILAFFGIRPGMRVLDMFSGGGYYTELLSYVVGPEGSVSAHTNEAYAQYVGDEAITRYGNDRLPNVEILMAENNELNLSPEEYDAVLLILSFHDIYYVDPKNGWPKIDGGKLLTEFYKGLKPGGVLGIVDHYAAAGSPRETGGTLHRIDPAIVTADLKAAGFVADGKSDALRNMEDDYSKNMADPAVRGKTDRFVFRFVKPE